MVSVHPGMLQERYSIHGGAFFQLDGSDEGFTVDGPWHAQLVPLRAVYPMLAPAVVDVPTLNHPLYLKPVEPTPTQLVMDHPTVTAKVLEKYPEKANVKALFELEWALPKQWLQWFSHPAATMLKVEVFLQVPPALSSPPVWTLDVSGLLEKAVLSAAAVSAAKNSYTAKWFVSGLFSFQGVVPKFKLSVVVDNLNAGYTTRAQFYAYLDGNAAGPFFDVLKA